MPKKLVDRVKELEREISTREEKWSYHSNYNATDSQNVQINTAAPIERFCDIDQGSESFERVGNKIHIKEIDYQVFAQNKGAAAQQLRLSVISWNGDNAPVLADIFNYPGAGAGNPDPQLATFNQLNLRSGVFSVKYDKSVWVEPAGISGKVASISMRMTPNRNQYYNGSAGADQIQGLYYILSSSSAGGATGIDASDAMMVNYTDM